MATNLGSSTSTAHTINAVNPTPPTKLPDTAQGGEINVGIPPLTDEIQELEQNGPIQQLLNQLLETQEASQKELKQAQGDLKEAKRLLQQSKTSLSFLPRKKGYEIRINRLLGSITPIEPQPLEKLQQLYQKQTRRLEKELHALQLQEKKLLEENPVQVEKLKQVLQQKLEKLEKLKQEQVEKLNQLPQPELKQLLQQELKKLPLPEQELWLREYLQAQAGNRQTLVDNAQTKVNNAQAKVDHAKADNLLLQEKLQKVPWLIEKIAKNPALMI
jgi:hypothetical protein